MTTEQNHALENAQGHMQTISTLMTALDALDTSGDTFADISPTDQDAVNAALRDAGRDQFDEDSDEACSDIGDTLREAATESALSIMVRDDWQVPGTPSDGPTEFQILLTTGGPALRIVGDLNRHAEPYSARMEWQDWGTPWTEYRQADGATLDQFASLFYFGQ